MCLILYIKIKFSSLKKKKIEVLNFRSHYFVSTSKRNSLTSDIFVVNFHQLLILVILATHADIHARSHIRTSSKKVSKMTTNNLTLFVLQILFVLIWRVLLQLIRGSSHVLTSSSSFKYYYDYLHLHQPLWLRFKLYHATNHRRLGADTIIYCVKDFSCEIKIFKNKEVSFAWMTVLQIK